LSSFILLGALSACNKQDAATEVKETADATDIEEVSPDETQALSDADENVAEAKNTDKEAAASENLAVPKLVNSGDDFVEGNLYFLALHELGHALISEFNLPVIGREEDGVDRLAIWMMTPGEDDKDPPVYLFSAIEGWFASANNTALEDISWWDEHGTDQQRGYQIACLLYGAEPARYKKIANKVDLPNDRRETCKSEAKSNDSAWDKLLSPHQRNEGDVAADSSIKISYEPTKKFKIERQYLQDIGVLDEVANVIKTDFKFKPGVSLVGTECGEPNAFWEPEARKLSICYELVAEFDEFATKLNKQ
jgi:Putative metallopeptidase